MTTFRQGFGVSKTEFEKLFHRLRKDKSRIIVKKHAFKDYPERGFSPSEIVELIAGPGRLFDNKAATAKPNSYVWHCRDEDENEVELVVLIEVTYVPQEQGLVLVISAFRRLKG